MSRLFDPRMSLAVSMHSQPGVFALLLGSGLSSAANIPTGWGVATDLTLRLALLKTKDPAQADAAGEAPEGWWAAKISPTNPLSYSDLLAELDPFPAGRRAIVSSYFTPPDDDLANNRKTPTAAHHAIARLIQSRAVRVIVTTNFDRLLEQALHSAGVAPTVLSTAAAWAGAPPLAHTRCIIVKVHGDYADLTQRNTTDELATYEDELNDLLGDIFNNYALLVSAWSAEWDKALRDALNRAASRRYGTYFATWAASPVKPPISSRPAMPSTCPASPQTPCSPNSPTISPRSSASTRRR